MKAGDCAIRELSDGTLQLVKILADLGDSRWRVAVVGEKGGWPFILDSDDLSPLFSPDEPQRPYVDYETHVKVVNELDAALQKPKLKDIFLKVNKVDRDGWVTLKYCTQVETERDMAVTERDEAMKERDMFKETLRCWREQNDALRIELAAKEIALRIATETANKLAAEVKQLEAECDPSRDATSMAHPAWWRGYNYGVAQICLKVGEILDGKDDGSSVAGEPWEATRRRLLALARGDDLSGVWEGPIGLANSGKCQWQIDAKTGGLLVKYARNFFEPTEYTVAQLRAAIAAGMVHRVSSPTAP